MRELDRETVDHLLTTTRAVRRRLDLERPVPREAVLECLRIAIQAPTASNAQSWRWILVEDRDKRAALADMYRTGWNAIYGAAADAELPDDMRRVLESASFLAEHLQDVPVHVVPCIEGRPAPDGNVLATASFFGSVFPAVWNLQLALRSRGLGSSLTTLHLAREADAAELLGLPDSVTQAALVPVAWFTGQDFRPAPRRPIEEFTYLDAWNTPIGDV